MHLSCRTIIFLALTFTVGSKPAWSCPPEAKTAHRLQTVGPRAYVIPRAKALSIVANFDRSLAGLNAEPWPDSSGEQVRGYHLRELDSTGVLSAAGFRAHDILLAINGRPFTSNRASKLWMARLAAESDFTVTFRRDGRNLNAHYHLKDE